MSLGTMAPTILAVGLVGYWAWPFVSAADAEAKKDPAVPQIAPAMLSPKIMPAPGRDPFREPGKAETPNGPHGPGTAPGQPKKEAPAASKGAPGQTGAAAASPKGPPGAKPPTAWLSALTLNATCTTGSRPTAMINGRLYSPGESLRLPGATVGPGTVPDHALHGARVSLAEIHAYRVVLESQGKKIDLGYANVDSGPRGSAPGKASPTGSPPRRAGRPAAGKSAAAASASKTSGGRAQNKSSR